MGDISREADEQFAGERYDRDASSDGRATRHRNVDVVFSCFDPLSSQGLFNALYGALQLAPAIAAGLAGDRRAISDYAGRLGSIWAAYRRHYGAYYRLERRWPNRAFWRRRHRPSDD